MSNNGNGNGRGRIITGPGETAGAPPAMPELPPLRTFSVRWFDPELDQIAVVTVIAHDFQHTHHGIVFQAVKMIDGEPRGVLVRDFATYIDNQEVI